MVPTWRQCCDLQALPDGECLERSRRDTSNPSFILKRYNASCPGAFPRPRHACNFFTFSESKPLHFSQAPPLPPLLVPAPYDAVHNSFGLTWFFLSFD